LYSLNINNKEKKTKQEIYVDTSSNTKTTKNIINDASNSEVHSRLEDEMLLINYTIIYTFHVKATLHEHAYYKKKPMCMKEKKPINCFASSKLYSKKKKQ